MKAFVTHKELMDMESKARDSYSFFAGIGYVRSPETRIHKLDLVDLTTESVCEALNWYVGGAPKSWLETYAVDHPYRWAWTKLKDDVSYFFYRWWNSID